ncbi:putative 2OG-Fe(II) oxygenase [Allosphingosinicella sp.]|uniref:putative 2OG-Fe(II) oxygenase n=1 Tax=Allosphingosinicella sp. TaxID=2823234 RepID=UPI003784F3EC
MTGPVEAQALLAAARPGDPEQVFRAVILASRAGLDLEALPLARAGAEASPRDARMWQVLGLVQRRLEDLAEAVPALVRAADLAPDDALIAHSLARASLEAGLPAVDLFERAHGMAPTDGTVLLGRAAAYFAEARLDDAIAGLEAQLRRYPDWIEGHATAVRLRWVRGDRENFTASLEEALAAAPASIPHWRELADAYMQAALYERVHDTLLRARAASGESPVYDALEAVATAEQGRIEEADRRFAALGPIEHVTMAARYVRHLLRAGRPAEASAFADGWAGRDPGNLLTPYQSAAWRLTGDPRWHWLEGDGRLVGVYDLGDRLPSLDALAERLRGLHLSLHQPLEQSLRGGTQTDGPLFSRIEPEIRALRALVVETVERHVAQLPSPVPGHPTLIAARGPVRFAGSWSVRLSNAGFHVNHVHPAGWISSAFYVGLPDAAMGGDHHAGWLSLGEATELGLDLPPIRLVEPKPGRLVLFPSTMWHGTRPFAEGERLTVAFDVARPL